MLNPFLGSLRGERGLAECQQIMNWWHSPQLIIGLFRSASLDKSVSGPSNAIGWHSLYDAAGATDLPPD